MISFDTYTLEAFIQEEQAFLTGARISKIQQPSRREFILTLRSNGKTRQLYINIQPQFYHICFIENEGIKKRLIKNPKQPPMFCMLLRKYLENSKIIKVVQPDNERIIEFNIETNNVVGDTIFPCLAIELMGKHSNVILYDSDTNIIIGSAHNIGADKSRVREVYGGIPYIYPPRQFNTPKFKSLVSELNKDNYSSINYMIDEYYSNQIYRYKFNELKTHYKSIEKQKYNKVLKAINQMENKLNSEKDFDKFRLFGDLLIANIYHLKDFSKEIQVFDYENDKDITISLDDTKTIKENANKFYKTYAKAKNAKEKLTEMLNSYRMQKEFHEQILYEIDSCENIADLQDIISEIEEVKIHDSNKNKTQNIKCLEKENGTKIYIGKNNKQNDYIISKLSSDDDLWFHVHNCAGSHVLLKTQNPTNDLILECAKLAKENSSAKDSSKVGVIYTQRKYIKKPPKANLGYVTYKNEKEIIID
jgi:predicted ribosome quality control (RQC) complex YloA/Tae2 family protein